VLARYLNTLKCPSFISLFQYSVLYLCSVDNSTSTLHMHVVKVSTVISAVKHSSNAVVRVVLSLKTKK